jgi:hypothetical protein
MTEENVDEKIQQWIDKLNTMDAYELLKLQRFAPAGHIVFTTPLLTKIHVDRFKELGGITPSLSKRVG